MKITETKQNGLLREYNVIVPADVIEKQLEQELQNIGKKAKVHGFRPGKIPMNVLKQRYGKDAMDNVLWDTINKTTHELLAEKKIRPSMKPDVNIVDYQEGGELEYNVSVEAMPDVPELKYDDITIPDYQCDVPEEEITDGLKRLAESQKHLHDTEAGTKAKKGDVVKIDFVGKLDGVEFPGGKGENFQLELGSGQFIPGFEEQLIGSKADDKVTVKVTFPKEYHSADLAGKDAEFDVTVHSVHVSHTPDVDDAFAEKMGFESLEKMKEAVTEQLVDDYKALTRNRAKKELFDYLDEKVKFEVPSKMLKLEFDSIWQQLQQAKARGDSSVNKPDEELRKEYEAISERRVRLGILLAEIGFKQNIQVTKDELTRAVVDQARMFPGQEQKVFEFYQKNPQHVEELKGPIVEEKAVDYVLSKVKRKETKISAEELMKMDVPEASDNDKPKKKASSSKKKSDSDESKAKKSTSKKTKKED